MSSNLLCMRRAVACCSNHRHYQKGKKNPYDEDNNRRLFWQSLILDMTFQQYASMILITNRKNNWGIREYGCFDLQDCQILRHNLYKAGLLHYLNEDRPYMI